ncbi:hypothetical protein EW145_g7993, partial [Phellinidium pouzarii]
DHISTAAAIGETQMDWNPSGGFMTYYMAALETEALKYHPLVIRRRRKVQRGSRGKHGKGKKDKNVAVCSLATPAEPETNIASVTAADSSFCEEVTGSVSASWSIYERPLANSSIPSLVSDTSSTASTVSLITLDSSYSGSVETAAPDVYDGTSTTESHTLVPAIKEDRPSLTQKITEFVQGYRTAQSINDDTLEEISEVSRHHKKTRRGTRHRGKGGKGKKVVTRPAEVSSEPATSSSAGASSSTGMTGSAPVTRPRLGSILAKTFSSATGTAQLSLLNTLLEDYENARTIDKEHELNMEFTTGIMFGAGFETASVLFPRRTFLLMMARNLDAVKRAQAEIDSVIGDEQLPTMKDRPNLPYIECVLKEVFRINPPAPLSLLHQFMEENVLPRKDHSSQIDDCTKYMKDESYYPNADDFKPERFLEKTTDSDNDCLHALNTFSVDDSRELGLKGVIIYDR